MEQIVLLKECRRTVLHLAHTFLLQVMDLNVQEADPTLAMIILANTIPRCS